MPSRHHLEAAVGAEGIALAREHARRVLAFALEGEDAGGERERAGHVLHPQPLQDLAVVLVARQRDLADLRAGQRRGGERRADLLVADLHDVLVAAVGLLHVGPEGQEFLRCGVEALFALGDEGVQVLRATPPSAVATGEGRAGSSGSIRFASLSCCRSRAMRACSQAPAAIAAHGVGRSRPGSARAPAARSASGASSAAWSRPAACDSPVFSPSDCSFGNMAWYSAVTPSSLKRAAMVPNTGISSGRLAKSPCCAGPAWPRRAARRASPCGRTC